MHKALLLIPIVMVAGIIGFSSNVFVDQTSSTYTGPTAEPVRPHDGEGIKIRGMLEVIKHDEDGNVIDYVYKKNLVVGEGLKTIWDLTFPDINLNSNATDNQFSWIRIGDGNTAPTAADTGLETAISGCNGVQDTTVTGGGNDSTVWAYLSVQFSGANCESTTVSEAVTANSQFGGEILARQTFSDINVGASDTLTVNWNFTASDDGT